MHGYRFETGWENFAHEGLVTSMNCYILIEVTNVLHRVSPSIVNGEGSLRKPIREFGLINSPNKGWFGNLLKSFTHRIIPHAMVRKPFLTLVPTIFQLVLMWRCRIWFTRWSSGPIAIWVIPAFPWSITWWWWWTPSIMLPMSQLLTQVISLLLQLPCLLIIWNMTPCPWVDSLSTIYVVRLYHNTWRTLPVSPSLQVNKLVLSLWANWLFPLLAYVSHDYLGQNHNTLMFPIDGANCKDLKIIQPKST